jgi:hypothetical protein
MIEAPHPISNSYSKRVSFIHIKIISAPFIVAGSHMDATLHPTLIMLGLTVKGGSR